MNTNDQFAAYRNTTPTRPAWATALIVALLLVICGVVTVVIGTSPLTALMFGSAFITLLVAGVLALTAIRR
jgi:hypothetical protein